MADITMGQRIGSERKKLGISQEMLGEQVGVSRQAISKWESDGAVPEIDKLIALSKLFGVSVGWLLGVEEDARNSDALSEKQLQMIEQIIKKYQPQPEQKKKHPWRIPGIIIVVVAAVIAGQFVRNAWQTHITDFNGLNTTLTYMVIPQLQAVESAINTQSAAQTTSLSLLAEYKMEIGELISAAENTPAAQVSFSAMPNKWQEGDTGFFSIRREGMETVQLECEWDGAFLTTVPILLDAENGYEFCFTLRHADGTQEQQALSDPDIQNLKKTLSITAELTSGQWSYEDNTLTLKNYEFFISKPVTGQFYRNILWEQVDLILTDGSGEELGRFSLLTAMDGEDSDVLASPEVWMEHSEIRFVDLRIPKNEGILLWLSAQTDNGLSLMEPVAAWTADADGKLRTQ